MPRLRLAGLAICLSLSLGDPTCLLAQAPGGGSELAGILGQGGGGGPGPVPLAAPVIPGLPPGISLSAVLAKVRAEQELTRSEFMFYLLAVEGLPANRAQVARSYQRTSTEPLPARAWAMISSRLHDTQYGSSGKHANDRGVRILWIDLFLNGAENQGWETIDILGARSPKFANLEDGRRLDVAHAYAGISALVMRDGEVAGTLMGRVNTDWGDTLQEAEDTRQAVFTLARGIFLPHYPQILSQGQQEWSQREARNPPEQTLGDELGNYVRDFLQDHRDAALSTGFDYGFKRITE